MFGEDAPGIIAFGDDDGFGFDPGERAGFVTTVATPPWRTFLVPALPRTFVVPGSDRYAAQVARVPNVPVGSTLDYEMDWRSWLGDDIILSSVWNNDTGEVVVDAEDLVVPLEPVLSKLYLTFGGKRLVLGGQNLVRSPTDVVGTLDEEDFNPSLPEETPEGFVGGSEDFGIEPGSGRVRSGVTSIRLELMSPDPVKLKNTITTLKGRVDERTMVVAGKFLEVGRAFEQDPDATLEYVIDFSSILATGELLRGTYEDRRAGYRPFFGYSPGLTFESRTVSGQRVAVWLSGGEVGSVYSMTVGFATSLFKTVFARIALRIVEK